MNNKAIDGLKTFQSDKRTLTDWNEMLVNALTTISPDKAMNKLMLEVDRDRAGYDSKGEYITGGGDYPVG